MEKIKFILMFNLFLVSIVNGKTGEIVEGLETRGSPFGTLTDSHISRGYGTSTATDFIVTSSLAETLVGTSTRQANPSFIVHTGLIKPSVIDLIFNDSFE